MCGTGTKMVVALSPHFFFTIPCTLAGAFMTVAEPVWLNNLVGLASFIVSYHRL